MSFGRSVLLRLLCVGAVAALMLPVGSALFPLVSDALDASQFKVLEAFFSAAVGYGLYATIGA